MAILPENEYTTFENRDYINPEVSLNEQMSFIDNLRDTQKQNNAQIRQQTYNLGTSVPSNLGGLVGGEGYWTSRYQTPQTNSLASELRSAAQAQALNDVLSNEQAKWKKRYNDAYNANQRRNANKANGGDGETGETEGGIEYEDNSYSIEGEIPGVAGGYTVGNIDTENQTNMGIVGVPYGEDGKTNYVVNFDDVNPRGIKSIKDEGPDYYRAGINGSGVSGYISSNPNHRYTITTNGGTSYQLTAPSEADVRGWHNSYYVNR